MGRDDAMKRRYLLYILLVILIIFSFAKTFAETDRISITREHLKEHSIIPDYLIDEMVIEEIAPDSGTKGHWTVALRMFAFELKSAFTNHPLIYISMDEHGHVMHCTCKEYSIQDYMHDAEYYYSVKTSVMAAAEWEKQYGPVQGWDANLYLQFLDQYHQIPNVIEDVYYNSDNYSLDGPKPTEDDIDVQEARIISDGILCNHLGIDPETISALTVGSTYEFEFGPSYVFTYYYQDDNNKFAEIYKAFIRVSDGKCVYAYRDVSDEEQNQMRSHPEKADEITSQIWWSDIDNWRTYFGW